MIRAFLLTAILSGIAAWSSSSLAETDERVAVEVLKGETPRDATLAFERACYRLGVGKVDAEPVQSFSHGGRSFVRLVVEGEPLITRCVSALEPGRAGVTGVVHWLDGFNGGLVVNRSGSPEDRVPEAEWVGPANVLSPPPDSAFQEQLSHGSSDAIDKLLTLDIESALPVVRSLRARGGPAAIAVLEAVAQKHRHWRVRRAAVEGLSSGLGALAPMRTLMLSARADPAPEVREAAVMVLQAIANPPIPTASIPSPEAAEVLLDVLAHDQSWIVRRRIIWSLARELVDQGKSVIRRLAVSDPDPHVRAAAMTALVGSDMFSRGEIVTALHDGAPEVRAVAAAALASEMEESDAPALWDALNDPDRAVRLAAVGFVTRITDVTIGPRLWVLYLQESSQLDADPAFERVVLDELGRAPFPGLASRMQVALASRTLSPDERRVLTRAFSRVDPSKAAMVLEPQLTSADPQTRSLAADAAPSTPGIQARRIALLSDAEADVRAGAVLGLCRGSSVEATVLAAIHGTGLGETVLAREALLSVPQCGRSGSIEYLHTELAAAPKPTQSHDDATLPAVLAMALMLVSVVSEKLSRGT